MRRPRILLVEDQAQVLWFCQTFRESICNVVGAVQDEADLIAATMALSPDILVVDMDLPRLNGMEVIRHVKKIVPNCYVILVTCCTEPECMAAAYDVGVSAYLVKGSWSDLAQTNQTLIIQPQGIGEWKTVAPVAHQELSLLSTA